MFRTLKPYQLIVDVAIAGVFAFVALWSELESGAYGPASVLGSVLTCTLLATALAVRRLSPGLALAIAWGGAIVQMGFGRPPIVADLAIFAVLYATAAYGSRATFWAGFGSSILGAVVITVYLFLVPEFAGGRLSLSVIPLGLAVLVAAGFALLLSWTFGALVRMAIRARENRRAQEAAEAEALVEQERVRIARDMHDVVAHSLAVVIAQADGARYAMGTDAGGDGASVGVAADALSAISTTARAALADVRVLLTQLRQPRSPLSASPSAPGGASGGPGPVEGERPQPTLSDLEALYAQVRASGVDLRVTVDPAPATEPPAGTQLAVYRILQEALTNALRHGDGGPVAVTLAWRADRVALEVRNALRAGPGAGGAQVSRHAVSGPGSPQIAPPERTGPGAGVAQVSRHAVSGPGSPRIAPPERTSPGHGIIGMRERAQLAGGRLGAGIEDGEFVVTAELPIGGVS